MKRNRAMNVKRTFTSRQRVIETMEHREPDRVPLTLGITYNAYLNLVDLLGISLEKDPIPDVWTCVEIAPEVINSLEIDLVHVGMMPAPGYPRHIDGKLIDEWGREWRRVDFGGSFYFELVKSPMADLTVKDLEDFPWPNPLDSAITDALKEKVDWWRNNSDKAIAVAVPVGSFQTASLLRGMEKWYMDTVLDTDFVHALMGKLADLGCIYIEQCCKAVGKEVDLIWVDYGDLGTQQGPLISKEMFDSLIKPYFKRTWGFAKTKFLEKNPRGKLIKHCCGGIYPFIANFIECGLDVLDPIQTTAKGMDPVKLKREFGNSLCFHGGIDTQKVLPYGTPEDVRGEVETVIGQLGPGGGYILTASHNIQVDVPPENILAMFEAAHEFGTYPLRAKE